MNRPVLIFTTLALAACQPAAPTSGDGGANDAGTADAGTVAERCYSIAPEICAKREACAHGQFVTQFGTLARCVEALGGECALKAKASGTALKLDEIEACRAKAAAASCSDLNDYELGRCPRSTGTRAAGMPCFFGEQCASGRCGKATGGDLCAVCESQGQEGQACDPDPDNGMTCSDGLQCIGGKCATAPISHLGETCAAASFRRCVQGLHCVNEVCQKQLPADAGCTEFDQCDALQGLYCEEGRCVPLPLSQDGGCFPIGSGAGGAICNPGQVCGKGFGCVTLKPAGAACMSGDVCAYGLPCLDGHCVSPEQLSCGGGTIDGGTGPADAGSFLFDAINPALKISCDGGTSELKFTGRYFPRTGSTLSLSVGASVTVGALAAQSVTVTPSTVSLPPGTAIAVPHAGASSNPAEWCQSCGQSFSLQVSAGTAGENKTASVTGTLQCQ